MCSITNTVKMKNIFIITVINCFLVTVSSQLDSVACVNVGNPSPVRKCEIQQGKQGLTGIKGEKGDSGGNRSEEINALEEKLNATYERVTILQNQLTELNTQLRRLTRLVPCDPGWVRFENHCYYFELKRPLPWERAENDCVSKGGHLTSILNSRENKFIVGNLNGPTWMGANDLKNESYFVWSDGSTLNYTNWAPGFLDNARNQDCGRFWSTAPTTPYDWEDFWCDRFQNYVCKMPS